MRSVGGSHTSYGGIDGFYQDKYPSITSLMILYLLFAMVVSMFLYEYDVYIMHGFRRFPLR